MLIETMTHGINRQQLHDLARFHGLGCDEVINGREVRVLFLNPQECHIWVVSQVVAD